MHSYKHISIPSRNHNPHWLKVRSIGDLTNPGIIFLHGAAGCSANWNYQIQAFKNDFYLVAPDLRGHGGSPWPGPSSLDDFYSDILHLCQSLLWERPFVVVCHSFGGPLGIKLAAEFPDRVSGLILCNTAWHLPRTPILFIMRLLCRCSDVIRRFYPWMLSTSSQVICHILHRTINHWNCLHLLPKIKAPTLVIAGGLDLIIPFWVAQETARHIRHSRYHLIPFAGHVIMLEQPELCTHLLSEFLEDIHFAPTSRSPK